MSANLPIGTDPHIHEWRCRKRLRAGHLAGSGQRRRRAFWDYNGRYSEPAEPRNRRLAEALMPNPP